MAGSMMDLWRYAYGVGNTLDRENRQLRQAIETMRTEIERLRNLLEMAREQIDDLELRMGIHD